MINPWLFLGIVAFGISFGISLLLTHDFHGALVAGSTALAIAITTAAIVNRYHNRSTSSRLSSLKSQIRTLQYRRAEEHQAIADLIVEKEQVFASLYASVPQPQSLPQLPGAAPAAASKPFLSWDLSAPVQTVPVEVYPPSVAAQTAQHNAADASLNQLLADTAATKQKIAASLNNLQTELSQLNSQVTEQRQLRDQLVQDISTLEQRKQKMVTTNKTLRTEVEALEKCRIELDHYLTYMQEKKQELDAGENPIQKTLKTLQEKAETLQTDLQGLETQVTARRNEKATLEQELAGLKSQQVQATALQAELKQLEQTLSDRRQEKTAIEQHITQLQAHKTALRSQSASPIQQTITVEASSQSASPTRIPKSVQRPTLPVTPSNGKGNHAAASAQSTHRVQTANPPTREALFAELAAELETGEEDALSDRWEDFMLQLPAYEFEALKAIAEDTQPLRAITKLAEGSFTSPDELIDSINQRAQDTLGERVIKYKSGFSAPVIFRDHLSTIKKLIETYEYLAE